MDSDSWHTTDDDPSEDDSVSQPDIDNGDNENEDEDENEADNEEGNGEGIGLGQGILVQDNPWNHSLLPSFVATCPVCNDVFNIMDFHSHLIDNHIDFYTVLLATANPFLTNEEFLGIMSHNQHTFPNSQDDELSYEEMLEICERIGNHYVGVTNIDEVAPVIDTGAKEMITCPICLENGEEDEAGEASAVSAPAIRSIRVCGHKFCAPCIESWLKHHKTCPICKKDAE